MGATAAHERPSEAASLARQYRRHRPHEGRLRQMNAVRRFRTDLAVASLTLPVEIVRGRKDRIATQDWCSELMRATNGRLTTVEGSRPHGPADPPRSRRRRGGPGPGRHPATDPNRGDVNACVNRMASSQGTVYLDSRHNHHALRGMTEATDGALAWGRPYPDSNLFEQRLYVAWEAAGHDEENHDACGP